MKEFVKQTKIEANKVMSSGPVSLTNQIHMEHINKTSLSKDMEDWKDLRYKLVRARWKKLHIVQDKPNIPIEIDKVIKEPPALMLTARPKSKEHIVDHKEVKIPEAKVKRSKSVVRPFSDLLQAKHDQAKARRENIEANRKVAPSRRRMTREKTENNEQRSEIKEKSIVQPTAPKQTLKDKVNKVVSVLRIKREAQDKLSKISHITEKSQTNNLLMSPERIEPQRISLRPNTKKPRRLSSSSVISHKSRMSSFGDLTDRRRRDQPVRSPLKPSHPEGERSSHEEQNSQSSSSKSPDDDSDDSGLPVNQETTPKVIFLNNISYQDDNGRFSIGNGVKNKLKERFATDDVRREFRENEEWRHVNTFIT